MTQHFLNLTNGLEWAPEIERFSLVRIQSTACEQKRWSAMIADLDYSFLVPLVRGERCVVYDCGARKETSRAIWQGLPFIRAAVTWRLYGMVVPVIWRGTDATVYAHDRIVNMRRTAKARLDYLKKFATGADMDLSGVSRETRRDGDAKHFVETLRRCA